MTNYFEKELELINDSEIRDFVEACLDHAPEYAFTIPATSSGKFHPDDEKGEGGSYLHLRKAGRVADDLCRNFNVTGYDRDCIIAAAIMHDLCKNGYPDDSGHTVAGHGSLWIHIVEEFVPKSDILKIDYIVKIGQLIGEHMGRWDIPYHIATDTCSLIVQIADYVVSRNYIHVETL